MAVLCGASCAKFMLFVFNFIFFLSGAALLGVGIWLLIDPTIKHMMDVVKVASDNSDQMRVVAFILIGVGVFIFVVGFFGCCGAIRESKCMLEVYIFLLFVVMCIEFAAGVFAIVLEYMVQRKLTNKMSKELSEDQYYNSTTKQYYPFGIAFNFAQKEFSCCGVNGPDDYKTLSFKTQNPGFEFPYSCCKLKDDTKFTAESPKQEDVADWTMCKKEFEKELNTYTQLHEDGCKAGIENWATDKLIILIGVGIGIAALELYGIIFAMCLCRHIDPDKQ